MAARAEFVLRNDLTQECIDIFESKAVEGKKMRLYFDVHFSPNQSWFLDADQVVSVLNPDLCLGVKISSGRMSEVLLVKRSMPNTEWIVTGGTYLCLKSHPKLFLSSEGDLLVAHKKKKSSSWTMLPLANIPNRASFCHLWYGPIDQKDIDDYWILECTVRVKESTDSTYFCVAGWSPGGYSGIQQIDGERRVAIFSMWNHADGDVSEVERGEGVEVSTFGGEGTGLKSMKEFKWKEGQDVTFVVEGSRQRPVSEILRGCIHSNMETWICQCWYLVDGEKHFMAAFKRRSREKPLKVDGFYSFAEDWNRSDFNLGHKIRRQAEFKDPKVRGVLCTKARFTKVETGMDAVGKDKAVGGFGSTKNSFFLATGGDDLDKIDGVAHGTIFDCTTKE